MGPTHVNPMTGQILDSDIIFDADFVDGWTRTLTRFAQPNRPETLGRAGLDRYLHFASQDPLRLPGDESAGELRACLSARLGLPVCRRDRRATGLWRDGLAGQRPEADRRAAREDHLPGRQIGRRTRGGPRLGAATQFQGQQLTDNGRTERSGKDPQRPGQLRDDTCR